MNWPNGKVMAVCLTWDVDGESAQYFRFPDRARNQLSELHQRLFGPQVGVWRVLRMLEKHGVPGTFYIPSFTAMMHPEVVKAFVSAGYPVGLHGHMHEAVELLDEQQENEVMRISKEILS
ncbi:MAG: polysaccharide deacetylase family protein [Polyangiaceae bacterium]